MGALSRQGQGCSPSKKSSKWGISLALPLPEAGQARRVTPCSTSIKRMQSSTSQSSQSSARSWTSGSFWLQVAHGSVTPRAATSYSSQVDGDANNEPKHSYMDDHADAYAPCHNQVLCLAVVAWDAGRHVALLCDEMACAVHACCRCSRCSRLLVAWCLLANHGFSFRVGCHSVHQHLQLQQRDEAYGASRDGLERKTLALVVGGLILQDLGRFLHRCRSPRYTTAWAPCPSMSCREYTWHPPTAVTPPAGPGWGRGIHTDRSDTGLRDTEQAT